MKKLIRITTEVMVCADPIRDITGLTPRSQSINHIPNIRKALSRLMKELKKGDECTETYSADEARKLLGLAE